MAFGHMIRPVFWRPKGLVPSLDLLGTSHGVIARYDVTAIVSGQEGGAYPLTVVEIADGKVIGNLRLAVTAGDVVIGGMQSLADCPEPENHYLLKPRCRCRLLKYMRGRALIFGGGISGNYYHWMMDSVPRWKILQAAGYFDYDYVLLPQTEASFEKEILDRLKIPEARRLRCSKHCVYQFERLVVPAMPFANWKMAGWVRDWLRSLFPAETSGPQRVFVSRRGATRRRLVNETGLETRLKAEGFVSTQPERLTVSAQASLFGAASCVVGAHGAGLANMVFAPPHALLVELFHPDIQRPYYKNLAAVSELRYVSVMGRRADNGSPRREENAQFEIDPSVVSRVIAANEATRIGKRILPAGVLSPVSC